VQRTDLTLGRRTTLFNSRAGVELECIEGAFALKTVASPTDPIILDGLQRGLIDDRHPTQEQVVDC